MTKIIVECDKCKHQYKIHDKRVGEKFHCFCGNVLTVPSVEAHDAAVVRCSACGGSRGKDKEPFCRYCGSSFTLHERDLNIICPHCMTRISSKAKFCHSCATPIVADSEDFETTDLPCPSCDDSKLHGRKMTGQQFSLKECNHCAGLWISSEVFRHLERKTQLATASGVQIDATIPKYNANTQDPKKYYRKCPQCNIMMHRRNYANSSGIIVDVCSKHGIWFDIHELDEVLKYIRSGKLLKQQEKSARKAQLQIKRARTTSVKKSNTGNSVYEVTTGTNIFVDIIDWLVSVRE